MLAVVVDAVCCLLSMLLACLIFVCCCCLLLLFVTANRFSLFAGIFDSQSAVVVMLRSRCHSRGTSCFMLHVIRFPLLQCVLALPDLLFRWCFLSFSVWLCYSCRYWLC